MTIPARIEANTNQHFRNGFEEALAFFQTERLVLFSGIAFTSSLMFGLASRFFCSNKLAGENGTNCASLLGSNSFEPRVAASNLIIKISASIATSCGLRLSTLNKGNLFVLLDFKM